MAKLLPMLCKIVECCSRIGQFRPTQTQNCRMSFRIRQFRPMQTQNNRISFLHSTIRQLRIKEEAAGPLVEPTASSFCS